MLKLDLVQTVALGGIVLLAGYGMRRVFPVLARYNLPAAVLGGLLVATAALIAHGFGAAMPVQFDTTLQGPLMIAFFATIGFGASVGLLRQGGPQLLLFLVISTAFAIAQNLLGMLVAVLFDLHPLFGVLAGSVTLTGGPATGLAFAPLFEQAGVPAATSIAIATAMAGIVVGGIVGGPVGTALIERFGVKPSRPICATTVAAVSTVVEVRHADSSAAIAVEGEDGETFIVLKSVIVILAAMWAGSWMSAGITALGITLPAYVGAMLMASGIRNVDDVTGWIGLSHRTVEVIGAVALSLFLVLALMTLRLWELAALAAPLIINLALQVILVVLACRWFVFKAMGADYEAAVMSGGFIGFMLGTTANAMAVMSTLTQRYGPAPRAFLVAPIVGAFFIDFTNSFIITVFVNMLR